MRCSLLLGALLLSGCAVPNAIDALDSTCPPPELGRPLWVRACAGFGAWVGGFVGGVVSIAGLPVTYPISLLAEDELGEDGQMEFLFFPAMGAASVGHACLGGAADFVDFTFHRAWTGDDVGGGYELVPQGGPVVSGAEGESAAGNAAEKGAAAGAESDGAGQ